MATKRAKKTPKQSPPINQENVDKMNEIGNKFLNLLAVLAATLVDVKEHSECPESIKELAERGLGESRNLFSEMESSAQEALGTIPPIA